MKKYLVDSGVLAAYLKGRKTAINLLTSWLHNEEATTSILVCRDILEYFAAFNQFERYERALQDLLTDITAYEVTYQAVSLYAHLRRALRAPHGPGLIGDIDTLIAATALQHGLTIVTADSDFQRIPQLQVLLIPRSALKK